MSEIDRIAEEICRVLTGKVTDWNTARARVALLEYASIVREECAKVCHEEAEDLLVEAQDHSARGWHRTEQELRRQAQGCKQAAESIRNANKG